MEGNESMLKTPKPIEQMMLYILDGPNFILFSGRRKKKTGRVNISPACFRVVNVQKEKTSNAKGSLRCSQYEHCRQ